MVTALGPRLWLRLRQISLVPLSSLLQGSGCWGPFHLTSQHHSFSLWLHFSPPGLEIQVCLLYLVSVPPSHKHMCPFHAKALLWISSWKWAGKEQQVRGEPQGSRNLTRFSLSASWPKSLTLGSPRASAYSWVLCAGLYHEHGAHLSPAFVLPPMWPWTRYWTPLSLNFLTHQVVVRFKRHSPLSKVLST